MSSLENIRLAQEAVRVSTFYRWMQTEYIAKLTVDKQGLSEKSMQVFWAFNAQKFEDCFVMENHLKIEFFLPDCFSGVYKACKTGIKSTRWALRWIRGTWLKRWFFGGTLWCLWCYLFYNFRFLYRRGVDLHRTLGEDQNSVLLVIKKVLELLLLFLC